jgi:hypothetical protein
VFHEFCVDRGGRRTLAVSVGDELHGASSAMSRRQGKVLIGEKTRHRLSRRLVLVILLINLITMRADVRPRVPKIFRTQCRIGTQQIGLTRAKSSCLFQRPDRNMGANNDRLATTDIIDHVDAGIGIPDVLDYALE